MGKKILDSKVLYVVLSILLTVGLWCYVTSTDSTPQEETYRNVPVEFTGLDILEDRGLMILNTNVTVNVRVRATPAVHARISNNGGMTVTVNVSSIGGEGTHPLAYSVNPPAGVSVSEVNFVTGAGGSVVNIDVARFLRREVPVKGSFQGQVAEGYLAGNNDDFLFAPATVWISGQAELVNQVSHALVTITEKDLTDTVRDEYAFQLIGASDNVLEDLDVACDVDRVYASFPIRATAKIPLVVKLTPGGGLSEDDVKIELTADSIMVAGSKDAVAAIVGEGAITLDNIDLASVRDGDELTFSVPLEDELENLSGIAEVKATVTIKKNVVIETFTATHIQPINEPEGWNVEIITEELPVEIRGTQKLMDELDEENIRVVVDLQNITPAAGTYTVPVRIALDSAGSKSEIGEMAANYTVVVSLTPAGTD